MRQKEFRALLNSVRTLTGRQREALRSALHASDEDLIATMLTEPTWQVRACPRCGGNRLIRWGRSNKLPRLRCKPCGRTFTALTGTALSGLRERAKWPQFAESLRRGETLEEAAERCGIHRNTAHRWRHRFLREPTARLAQLCGIAEADETFLLRSAKGQPELRRAWGRPPRKRGGRASRRGRSAENVAVLVARDRSGATLDAVLERFDAQKVHEVLGSRLARDSILCTDGLNTYRTLARELGVRHEPLTAVWGERVRGPFHIQNVNNYHSRWKTWMKRFRGVSTRYLHQYLGWFRALDRQPVAAPVHYILQAALPL